MKYITLQRSFTDWFYLGCCWLVCLFLIFYLSFLTLWWLVILIMTLMFFYTKRYIHSSTGVIQITPNSQQLVWVPLESFTKGGGQVIWVWVSSASIFLECWFGWIFIRATFYCDRQNKLEKKNIFVLRGTIKEADYRLLKVCLMDMVGSSHQKPSK